MKKFDFRKLLVLVLALVLIFALVACGPTPPPDEDDPDPVAKQYTAADYFTALWDASKSIGATPIASSSDLEFEIGLDIDLAIKTGTATTVDYKLGLDVKAIYDRDNTGSDANVGKYSAAMVKITDRNAKTNNNLLSVYYYLDDPTVIYAQVYDQNLKIQFNADNQDGAAANGLIVTNLTSFLNKKMESNNTFVDGKSIDDIILAFTNSFGPTFNLDAVVDVLLSMLGIDMGDLIATIQDLISFDVADADNASLLDVLNGLGKVALNSEKGAIKKTAIDGGFTWSASLKSIVKTLLAGYTDGLVNDANTTINLKFDTNTAGNEIKNFVIELDRKNITGNKSIYAKIAIRTLRAKATVAKASTTNVFGMTKTDFKEDYKVNLNLTISLQDAMLKMTYDDSKSGEESYASIAAKYSDDNRTIAALDKNEFAGVLRIEADGMLNLLKNDSKTAGYAKVFYKANNGTEQMIVEARYENTDGVGEAKIWMDDEYEYAQIARDYLLLNLVRFMHNSNEFDAVDAENPSRAELLAGTNGEVIAALIGALNSEATTYIIKGLELQTMLWDLFFVEDAPKVDPYENLVFEKLPSSQYQWGVDFLAIAKTALNVASQSNDNAIAVSFDGIAATLLSKLVNKNGVTTHFGIFETLSRSVNNGTVYDSFESLSDVYSWFYKGSQSVIIRMTDAGIIGAIKIVQSNSGKYTRNADGKLVEYVAKSHPGATRYNVVKSDRLEDIAAIGDGVWMYQNSSTLDKNETRKMWILATDLSDTSVKKVDTTALTTGEREAIYNECIESMMVEMLVGSTFIGGTVEEANKGQWLDNILAGKLDGSISYVGADGVTVKLVYTDKAGKVASIELNASVTALDTPYVASAGTNLSFDEATAGCVIDLSSYMEQVRLDYAAQ